MPASAGVSIEPKTSTLELEEPGAKDRRVTSDGGNKIMRFEP